MTTFCDCRGAWTDCERCDDSAQAAEYKALCDSEVGDPMKHHIHLCWPCEKSGCNFTEPNGEGEKCADFDYVEGDCTIEPLNSKRKGDDRMSTTLQHQK